MTTEVRDIDPRRLYSFAEAATLMPSPHAGRTLSVFTLRRWARSGQLKAQKRRSGKQCYYFAWGCDLLEAMGAQEPPRYAGRSPAARQKAAEAAMQRLRDMGVLKEGNTDAESP